MIYLIVFTLSIFFTYIAQRTTKQRPFFFLFSLCAILLPTLLAGFRDSGIGTDTIVYVDDVWKKILFVPKWSDFINTYNNRGFNDIEFIYLLFNWLTSKITSDVHGIYFVANLVVIYFIYRSAYDNRNKCEMWLVMTFFYLLYYNISLNLVRQSIALSMCVYAYKYIEQKNWKKIILWSFFIVMAHNTGVFFLIVLFIFYLFQIKNIHLRNLLIFSFITFMIIGLMMLDFFLILSVNWGILPEKFLMYVSYLHESSITKSILIIYILLLGVLYFIKSRKYKYTNNRELELYSYSKLIGVLLYTASIVSKWAFRISFYINYPTDCIFIPRSLFFLKKNKKKYYRLILTVVLLLLIILWNWSIVLKNDNETYPYKSSILGI